MFFRLLKDLNRRMFIAAVSSGILFTPVVFCDPSTLPNQSNPAGHNQANVSSSSLINGSVYDTPFIRADLLFIASDPWKQVQINDDIISAPNNSGIFQLNYIVNFKQGQNTVTISGETVAGNRFEKIYTVYFPEKNLNLIEPKRFYAELEARLTHDTNPLFREAENSTDEGPKDDFFRSLGGQAFYFIDDDYFMNYRFMDHAYLKKENLPADNFSHQLTINRSFPDGNQDGGLNIFQIFLHSMNIGGRGYINEAGLSIAADRIIATEASGQTFYRITAYVGQQKFLNGYRESYVPFFVEVKAGKREKPGKYFISGKLIGGQTAAGERDDDYRYIYFGLDFHKPFGETERFAVFSEIIAGEQFYPNATDQSNKDNQQTALRYQVGIKPTYALGRFEFAYRFTYDEVIDGPTPYQKILNGISTIYYF